MKGKIVNTQAAPKAVGPYSQAVDAGSLLFCSGQLGLDPETMKFAAEDVEGQTRQVFANIKAVLAEAGLGLENLVKTTVFLADMGDFPRVNAIYQEIMGENKPARSTVQVAALPLGGLVEIECIALK